MGAIHKPRKFQFREIQNRKIQEVAVLCFEKFSKEKCQIFCQKLKVNLMKRLLQQCDTYEII